MIRKEKGKAIGENRTTNPITVGILLRLVSPPIQHQLRPPLIPIFLHPSIRTHRPLNQSLHPLHRLRTDQRPHVHPFLKPTINNQSLCPLHQHLQEPLPSTFPTVPILSTIHKHNRTQRHTPLPRRSKRRPHDRAHRLLDITIRHHDRMVLRAQVSLAPFPRRRCSLVNVLAGGIAADEADGFYDRAVEKLIDGLVGAMDDVDDARWEAGFASEFGEDEGSARVALGRFEDDGVAGDGGQRDGPEGNHSGEVCREVVSLA